MFCLVTKVVSSNPDPPIENLVQKFWRRKWLLLSPDNRKRISKGQNKRKVSLENNVYNSKIILHTSHAQKCPPNKIFLISSFTIEHYTSINSINVPFVFKLNLFETLTNCIITFNFQQTTIILKNIQLMLTKQFIFKIAFFSQPVLQINLKM